jgi:ATP-dependent DNA ligase
MDGFRAVGLRGERRGAAGIAQPEHLRVVPAAHGRNRFALPVRDWILDGEIVYLDANVGPQFFDLMRSRQPQHFYALDLPWLDGFGLRACR